MQEERGGEREKHFHVLGYFPNAHKGQGLAWSS